MYRHIYLRKLIIKEEIKKKETMSKNIIILFICTCLY